MRSQWAVRIGGRRRGITVHPVWPWNLRRRRELAEMDVGPDGRDEHLFRPLAETEPDLARSLVRRFAETWLIESGFPSWRLSEAIATVDLRVGPGDQEGDSRLRVTSGYTGSTRWLDEWTGDAANAIAFIEEVAAEEARWVHDERRMYGPTPWDEESPSGS